MQRWGFAAPATSYPRVRDSPRSVGTALARVTCLLWRDASFAVLAWQKFKELRHGATPASPCRSCLQWRDGWQRRWRWWWRWRWRRRRWLCHPREDADRVLVLELEGRDQQPLGEDANEHFPAVRVQQEEPPAITQPLDFLNILAGQALLVRQRLDPRQLRRLGSVSPHCNSRHVVCTHPSWWRPREAPARAASLRLSGSGTCANMRLATDVVCVVCLLLCTDSGFGTGQEHGHGLGHGHGVVRARARPNFSGATKTAQSKS